MMMGSDFSYLFEGLIRTIEDPKRQEKLRATHEANHSNCETCPFIMLCNSNSSNKNKK